MALKFHTTPSQLLSLTDPWESYCFNRAVYHFGTELEAEMDKVKDKNENRAQRKREQILRKWIPEAAPARQFRDPAKG